MAMMRKPTPLNLAIQQLALQECIPDSTASIRSGTLTWKGRIQPRALSRPYLVRLRYRPGKRPQVHVLAPPLQQRDGQDPEHLHDDGSLCLYYIRADPPEWDDSMRLADRILPWASEWLYNYENWLAIGTWTGGGVHPGWERQAQR